MSLDPWELEGLTEEDMGEIRDTFHWGNICQNVMVQGEWRSLTPRKLKELEVDRTPGMEAAYAYLEGNAMKIIHCKPSIVVPLVVIIGTLAIVGILAKAIGLWRG